MSASTQDELARKLDFLRLPTSYADAPAAVEAIETHFAWVFLSRDFAYKLVKPIKFHGIDFSTLAKRKANAERSIRLNCRLAEAVYIATVPLLRTPSGLSLDGDGEPVDWLIKMHRLPAESMLDRHLAVGHVDKHALIPVLAKLLAFYREAPRAPWDGDRYIEVLKTGMLQAGEQLSALPGEIDVAAADRLVAAELGFVERYHDELAARVLHGRVVDAHGDLRPEHVGLADNPQIIDCLEFSDKLRLLDTADELGFLALECERLGHAKVGAELLASYRAESADPVSLHLLDFYQSRQALHRAVLSAWHLEEPLYAATQAHWVEQTAWYLGAGQARISRALT